MKTKKRRKKKEINEDPPKNLYEAIYNIFRFKTKEILIIVIIGLIIFFNVSYNKKEGLVIKPGVKVEVKK